MKVIAAVVLISAVTNAQDAAATACDLCKKVERADYPLYCPIDPFAAETKDATVETIKGAAVVTGAGAIAYWARRGIVLA